MADDRLRLIFTCCHPALSTETQVALTLRLLCGLSTGEVARSFLVTEQTMAVRLVRAKRKIKAARIPYRVPGDHELPEWNARVHHVIAGPASASPVAEGTEWVVQMRASGGRWPSRSRALVVDPVAHRFEYETHTDDGNPSFALWPGRSRPPMQAASSR